ncbi:hypothetical protein GQR58_001847 [Nymphon striatum]|nr:hypothetical protein GQR58_001847 [Nymphon striatum]
MTLLYTGPPFNVLSEGRTITISLNKAHCYMEPFFVTNRPKSAEDANLLGGFEGMPLSSSHILKVHLGNLYQYIKTGSLSETTCCPRSFEDCLAQQVTSLLEEEGIRPMWPACTTYGPETWVITDTLLRKLASAQHTSRVCVKIRKLETHFFLFNRYFKGVFGVVLHLPIWTFSAIQIV